MTCDALMRLCNREAVEMQIDEGVTNACGGCGPVADEIARWPLGDDTYIVIATRGHQHDAEARGAGEILLTSMDRDGTKDGFDIALTRAVARFRPRPHSQEAPGKKKPAEAG